MGTWGAEDQAPPHHAQDKLPAFSQEGSALSMSPAHYPSAAKVPKPAT